MEKNIIKEELFPSLEQLNEAYLNEIVEQLKKYTDIDITSKILHYLPKPTFCYYCTVYKKTNSNPFNIHITFCFEFIDGEIPYATILTDFIEPSLNDNRNYYRCLTKEHKYIFNADKIKEHQIILESMIQGIGNFLTLLEESTKINSFVFFGEYEYKHVYQINDFLMSKNYLNFYRINVIKENKEKERYILFTKLYYLLFEPLRDDKALIKLLHQHKLKDMNIYFDKNTVKKSLIINISSKKNNENMEFTLIDRKQKVQAEKTVERIRKNNSCIILNEKNITLDQKKEKENKNEIKDNKNKENEKNEKNLNYSILIKEWFTYMDRIDFTKYEIVINKYDMLFNESRESLKIKEVNVSEIEEYSKLINFYEKLINYYENEKNKNYKDKIKKNISSIIYLCSELVNFANDKNKEKNEYLLKVKKYLEYYK